MTIQYASDLHIEFQANRAWLFENGVSPSAEILVLAGDIAYLGDRQLMHNEYFDWLSANFKQVYIVPGNHEYYRGVELRDTLTNYEYLIRVRYINNNSVVIGDTELFFTSLWSKVPNAFIADIQNGMMDTRLICYKNALLFAGEFNELHKICTDWLNEALNTSKAKHKVVVTHHCPTTKDIFNGYIGSRLNCGFMVDMEEFINANDINYWIFGHTHFNGDNSVLEGRSVTVGQTRLLTNQLGYVQRDEQRGFNPAVVVPLY